MDKRALGIEFAEAATLAKSLEQDMNKALSEGKLEQAYRLQHNVSQANVKAAQAYSKLYSNCDSLATFLEAVQAGYQTVEALVTEDKGGEGFGCNCSGLARCCE